MIDILAAVAAIGAAAGSGSGGAADAACGQYRDPFDGRQLVTALLQMPPAATVDALVGPLTAVEPGLALAGRGFIVRNAAGRLGVTVGYGRVVEPGGRRYVITDSADQPDRWVAAWAAPTVRYTA